jgi:hypothetical protein
MSGVGQVARVFRNWDREGRLTEDRPPDRRQATHLEHAQQLTEETAQKLLSLLEKSPPVRRLRASQVASAVIGSVGFALFIVGVEQAAQDIPVISDAYGSIAVGLALLLLTGLLLRKLAGGD